MTDPAFLLLRTAGPLRGSYLTATPDGLSEWSVLASRALRFEEKSDVEDAAEKLGLSRREWKAEEAEF